MTRAPALAADLELALTLADAADAIATPRFRAVDLAVETKPDGSPVTDADRSVEDALRRRLHESRPGDAVVGEEGGASGESERCWYLDPIDGTANFVAGDPEWYVLISLAVGGRAAVGVASAPALGERWWAARGLGAFRDGTPVRVSHCAELARATVTDDWHRTLAAGTREHPLVLLADAVAAVRLHRGYSHLVVAAGAADVALGIGGSAWDFAPTKVIVEEAGGRFTDIEGRDSFTGGSALASNGRLHDQALRAIGARVPTVGTGMDQPH
jgi:histidinol-phosphatase